MTKPVIGAALDIDEIETWRDWLFEKDGDLEIQSFHSPALLDGDWRGAAERARALLDGFRGRLGIHGPFWGFALDSQDPEIRRVVARRLEQGLDVCAALGAAQMVVHSPTTTWDHQNFDNRPGEREAQIARVHETMGAAVRRAADQGVVLVIENIEDRDPGQRRRLAESFGSDAVRVSLDTGHAHYAHGSTGAPPVDHYVADAGAALAHVHLQDADGYADRHWALGEGTIRWHAVFRALAALPVRPHLVLELRDRAGIAASMDFLAREGLAE